MKSAHKKAPGDFIALLHLAELNTHENNFDEGVHLLRKARRLSEAVLAEQQQQGPGGSYSSGRDSGDNNKGAVEAAIRAAVFSAPTSTATAATGTVGTVGAAVGAAGTVGGLSQQTAQAYQRRAQRAQEETLANIISLLGINLFRQLPARPEVQRMRHFILIFLLLSSLLVLQ